MYLIGLTGGIASGKTTVATRLAELGAVHIDADQVSRRVVEPGTPALAAISETFGSGILRDDGSLDRPALGAVVFSDPQALQRLNGIVHPAVWRLTRTLIDEAVAADPDAIIVYDVPLLVEADDRRSLGRRFDLVVVVHADMSVRLRRLMEIRGMSEQDAESRLRSQATDAERLAIADVVIDSSGTLEDTLRQADELYEQVQAEVTRRAVSGTP